MERRNCLCGLHYAWSKCPHLFEWNQLSGWKANGSVLKQINKEKGKNLNLERVLHKIRDQHWAKASSSSTTSVPLNQIRECYWVAWCLASTHHSGSGHQHCQNSRIENNTRRSTTLLVQTTLIQLPFGGTPLFWCKRHLYNLLSGGTIIFSLQKAIWYIVLIPSVTVLYRHSILSCLGGGFGWNCLLRLAHGVAWHYGNGYMNSYFHRLHFLL
jgi:hypothetical protein